MTKKKISVKPEPDMLTSTAQKIGSTLGSLALKVGLVHPAAPTNRKVLAKKTTQVAAKKKAAAASAKVRSTKAGVARGKKGG
jgi:hypothetical protein